MNTNQLIKNLQRPTKKVDVILDTDAYNEIDDQFAIAYMFANPDKLNVKALYAAPFYFPAMNNKSTSAKDGMERSYDEILKVLSMIDVAKPLKDEVYRGSDAFLKNDQTPINSPAAQHLAKLAMEYDSNNPLYVVAIGAISNVASAILLNPKIIDRIVIVWLGGHAFHCPDTKEFNMYQDMAAARAVFNSGVPLVQLPCHGVVSALTVSEAELSKWLLGKNDIAHYLASNTIEEVTYAKGKPWSRVIWDVAPIAWLLDEQFMSESLEKCPIPQDNGHYSHSSNRHFMKYVYHIHRDALVDDLFKKILTL